VTPLQGLVPIARNTQSVALGYRIAGLQPCQAPAEPQTTLSETETRPPHSLLRLQWRRLPDQRLLPAMHMRLRRGRLVWSPSDFRRLAAEPAAWNP
jgi:hypothetical protein